MKRRRSNRLSPARRDPNGVFLHTVRTVDQDGDRRVDTFCLRRALEARATLNGYKAASIDRPFFWDADIVAWVRLPNGMIYPEADKRYALRPVETKWGDVFFHRNHLVVMDESGSIQDVITDQQIGDVRNDDFETCVAERNNHFVTLASASAAWIIAACRTSGVSLCDFADKWPWDPFANLRKKDPECCLEVLRRVPKLLTEMSDRPDVAVVFLETLERKTAASYPALMSAVLKTRDQGIAARALQVCPWLEDRGLALTAAGVAVKLDSGRER